MVGASNAGKQHSQDLLHLPQYVYITKRDNVAEVRCCFAVVDYLLVFMLYSVASLAVAGVAQILFRAWLSLLSPLPINLYPALIAILCRITFLAVLIMPPPKSTKRAARAGKAKPSKSRSRNRSHSDHEDPEGDYEDEEPVESQSDMGDDGEDEEEDDEDDDDDDQKQESGIDEEKEEDDDDDAQSRISVKL